MDDGQAPSRQRDKDVYRWSGGTTLCTDNFSIIERDLLQNILIEKFNLDCKSRDVKKNNIIYPRIYISKNSREKLIKLVNEYMIDEKKYKVNPVFNKLFNNNDKI